MRRTLFFLFLLGFTFSACLFIYKNRKTYVSFDDVSAVKYGDLAQNQGVRNDFIRVIKDKKWGIARKKNGEVMLPLEFENIDEFYEGYAVVKKDDLYGAINENFELVIKPEWMEMRQFHLGYAVVYANNGKAGVIDVNGKVIIKPLYYDYISSFDDNFVAFAENYKDGKKVLLDIKGNIVK